MRIATPHGDVSLSRPSGDRIVERFAGLWRLPIVRHGDGDYGLAFQVGRREAWCTMYALPPQSETELSSLLRDVTQATRESLVMMAGVGQSGYLLPCAFMQPRDDGRVVTGVVVFSSDQEPVGGSAVAPAPLRDRFIQTFSTSEAGALLPAFERIERLPRLSVGMMKLEMALVAGEPLLLAAEEAPGRLEPAVEASLTLWARRGVKHVPWAPAVPSALTDADILSLIEVAPQEPDEAPLDGEASAPPHATPGAELDTAARELEAAALELQAATRSAAAASLAALEPAAVEPEGASVEPEAESAEPEAESAEPEAESAEPQAESAAPQAESAEPIAVPILPPPKPKSAPSALPSATDAPIATALPLGRPTQPLFAIRLPQRDEADVPTEHETAVAGMLNIDATLAAVLHNPFNRLMRIDADAVHAELIAAAFEVCVRVGRFDVIPRAFGPANIGSIVMGGVAGVQLLLRHSATETCAVAVRAGTGLDVRQLAALAPVMLAGCSQLAAVCLTLPVPLHDELAGELELGELELGELELGEVAADPWHTVALDAVLAMIQVAADNSPHPDFFRAHSSFVRASRRLWQAVGDAAAGDGSAWREPLRDAELLRPMERMLALELLDFMDARLEPERWPRLLRGPVAPPTAVESRALALQIQPSGTELTVALLDPQLPFACGVRLRSRRIELFVAHLDRASHGRDSTPAAADRSALMARICSLLELDPTKVVDRQGQPSTWLSLGSFDWLDGVSRQAAAQTAVEMVWLMWHHFDDVLGRAES